MASHTKGIQQLLAAEKRAAEKVQEARKRKQRRLRQAKEEAEVEIEKFRAERERQFKEFEAKHVGSKEGAALTIDLDARLKIEELKETISTNRAKVIDELLNMVYDITPQLHRNCDLQINGLPSKSVEVIALTSAEGIALTRTSAEDIASAGAEGIASASATDVCVEDE